MKAIARGCLELLIAWAAAGAGLYYYFHTRFEGPGDIVGAAAGGLFVAMAWGSFRNIILAVKQRRLIRNSRTQTTYQDGEPMVAIGTIRALNAPIITPFQKKEAVILGYNVYHERITRTRSSSGNSYDESRTKDMLMGGFVMTPCAIRTPLTQVKIFGFPLPTEFPEEEFAAVSVREEIGEYCKTAQFSSTNGVTLTGMISHLKNALTDDDGSIREEWRKENVEAEIDSDPDSSYCSEQFVPNNSQVCAFGTYSSQKGGMVSNLSHGGLLMYPGDEKKALSTLRGKIVQGVILSLVFTVIGTLGAYGILTARESSNEVQQIKRDRIVTLVEENDLPAAQMLMDRGINFSTHRDSAERVFDAVKSPEMMIMLKNHGLNINMALNGGRSALHNAVYRQDLERVRMLLAAGADVNFKQREYGVLPLETAFDSHNKEIYSALEAAGAKGVFITAQSGKAINAQSDESRALGKFLKAYANRDVDGIRGMVEGWPNNFFESFANGLYDGFRWEEFKLIRGYSNGDVATLFIQFPTGSSPDDIWIDTLVKRDGVWRVKREGLDEKGAWKEDLKIQ